MQNDKKDLDSRCIHLLNLKDWNEILEMSNEIDKQIIVDFYGKWCGPCKVISPYLDELSVKYNDKSIFVKIDADKFYGLLKKYNITCLPTFIVIKQKEVIDKLEGGNIDKFLEFIKNHCE